MCEEQMISKDEAKALALKEAEGNAPFFTSLSKVVDFDGCFIFEWEPTDENETMTMYYGIAVDKSSGKVRSFNPIQLEKEQFNAFFDAPFIDIG